MLDKKLVKGLKNFVKLVNKNREEIQRILFSPEMAQKLQFFPKELQIEKRVEKKRVDHEDPLGENHSITEDVENFYLYGVPIEINFAIKKGALIILNNDETIIIDGI